MRVVTFSELHSRTLDRVHTGMHRDYYCQYHEMHGVFMGFGIAFLSSVVPILNAPSTVQTTVQYTHNRFRLAV